MFGRQLLFFSFFNKAYSWLKQLAQPRLFIVAALCAPAACIYPKQHYPESFDRLVSIGDERTQEAWGNLEEDFYRSVKSGIFDGTYQSSLIISGISELSPYERNKMLYTLLTWLDGRDELSAKIVVERINKIYHLEFHRFLTGKDFSDECIPRIVGIFHCLSKFKRDDAHEYYFRTIITKIMLALEVIDSGNQRHSERKLTATHILEKFKRTMLDYYQALSQAERARLMVDQRDICFFVQTLETHALRPPLAESRTFQYVAAFTLIVVITYLVIKKVKWKECGYWMRDNIIHPMIEGVVERMRDCFIYHQVQDPNRAPGETMSVIAPAFINLGEAMAEQICNKLSQPQGDQPALATQMAQGFVAGIAPAGMENPTLDMVFNHVAAQLRNTLTQPQGDQPALAEQFTQQLIAGIEPRIQAVSQQLAQGFVAGVAPAGMENPSIDLVVQSIADRLRATLTQPQGDQPALATQFTQQLMDGIEPRIQAISQQLSQGFVAGVAPVGMENPSLERVAQGVAEQLRNTLTQPQGNQPALATQFTQQLMDGIEPRIQAISQQLSQGFVAGVAPVGMENPSLERVAQGVAEQLRNTLTQSQGNQPALATQFTQQLMAGIEPRIQAVSQQLAQGFVAGVAPAGMENPSLERVAQGVAEQLRATITQPQGDQPALAEQFTQQLMAGIEPRVQAVSQQLAQGLVAGLAPEDMENPTLELVIDGAARRLRAGAREDAAAAINVTANYVRTLPGGRFLVGRAPQQQIAPQDQLQVQQPAQDQQQDHQEQGDAAGEQGNQQTGGSWFGGLWG